MTTPKPPRRADAARGMCRPHAPAAPYAGAGRVGRAGNRLRGFTCSHGSRPSVERRRGERALKTSRAPRVAVSFSGRVSLPSKTPAPPRRRKRAPLRQAPRPRAWTHAVTLPAGRSARKTETRAALRFRSPEEVGASEAKCLLPRESAALHGSRIASSRTPSGLETPEIGLAAVPGGKRRARIAQEARSGGR